MKAAKIIVILIFVIVNIGYTSASGLCKPKGKCRKKGGLCSPSSTCSAGFTKVPRACKDKSCTCCSPQEPVGCQCGQANPSRVVGGFEVFPKYKYPWHVWIQKDRYYLCGGSIINDRYILTAAHCVFGYFSCSVVKPNKLKVVVADHDKDSTADDAAVTRTVSVAKVIVHPGHICPELNSDIALLKLSVSLDLSSHRVQPVCLPKDDSKSYQGEQAVVTGWGYTTGGGPELPSLLHEVEVPVIRCPGLEDYGGELTPSMLLCAGVPEKGKDSCNGDSGGPLVVKETNSRYVQVGIVSFGPVECTGPGIYTRVSKYLKWIKKKTKKAITCSGRSSPSAADTPHKIPFTRKRGKKEKAARAVQVPVRPRKNAGETIY